MFIYLFFFLGGSGASVDIVVEVGGFYLFFLSSCELTFTVFACDFFGWSSSSICHIADLPLASWV